MYIIGIVVSLGPLWGLVVSVVHYASGGLTGSLYDSCDLRWSIMHASGGLRWFIMNRGGGGGGALYRVGGLRDCGTVGAGSGRSSERPHRLRCYDLLMVSHYCRGQQARCGRTPSYRFHLNTAGHLYCHLLQCLFAVCLCVPVYGTVLVCVCVCVSVCVLKKGH